MKTYEVTYSASLRHTVKVSASNEDEAYDKSWKQIWKENENDKIYVNDWCFDWIEEMEEHIDETK